MSFKWIVFKNSGTPKQTRRKKTKNPGAWTGADFRCALGAPSAIGGG